MPSLGRTFGGNGDLLAPGSRIRRNLPCSRPPRFLAASRWTGRTFPSPGCGLWPASIPCRWCPAGKRNWRRQLHSLEWERTRERHRQGIEKGRVVVDYDAKQQPIFEKIREVFPRAGDRKRPEDLGDQETHHRPRLGWRLPGPNADRGVVDHKGEVYGNPGLFVADASALPAAAGTPPSLAIAAWAHHVADRLAQRAT